MFVENLEQIVIIVVLVVAAILIIALFRKNIWKIVVEAGNKDNYIRLEMLKNKKHKKKKKKSSQ